MNAPLFSIIIPTFNAEKTMARCLDSITRQKFSDFEIIIVDSVSTDKTTEIIKSYAIRDTRIKCISEKDHGIFDAMNKGILSAKGEWVYFLGSDDSFINEDVLERIAISLKAEDEIIYGNSVWLPSNFSDIGEKTFLSLLNEGINHQRIFYRKRLFQQFGFYKTEYKFASDMELNDRFFCNAAIQKRYLDIPIAFFNGMGISSQYIDEELWKNWRTIFVRNFKPFLPKNQIYRRLSWYCWFTMQKKKYKEAFVLFCLIYRHTLSFTFLKHTISQAKHISRKKNY